ncbi:MAG: hypothetical protein BWY74_01881 [Firmicutes bacterium ADurb.Bin419]|nr:MAG: hypothetical protein BWY74_01881 [Firmicutes bacterium ADurb.Bin419]
MQLEGMLLLLTLIILIPILSIFSNDTAFFIILSLVLSFSSMKKIMTTFFPVVHEDDNETNELMAEIRDDIDLDFGKIKKGIKTVKALVIILFFIYTCFFLKLFLFKIIASFIIVYWIRYISNIIKTDSEDEEETHDSKIPLFEKTLSVSTNILIIILIISTFYDRFFSY